MKQIKFDKCYKEITKYIDFNKWYEVISEGNMCYKVKDESNTENSYPKTWASEEREKVE